jgi:hypothetical protein
LLGSAEAEGHLVDVIVPGKNPVVFFEVLTTPVPDLIEVCDARSMNRDLVSEANVDVPTIQPSSNKI